MLDFNKKTKFGTLLLIFLATIYLGILIYPNFLFAHNYDYKNFEVYSDKRIPIEIEMVLNKAIEKVQNSELYEESDFFRVYFCNSKWRLALLTRNSNVGGLVNQGLSRNIYIRESEIENNKIVSPIKDQEILLAEERPLSYFLAHEMTHCLQTKISRFINFKSPKYIVEGYADYIAKGNRYNYKQYLVDFKTGHQSMSKTSNLYNRYHLMIAYLMDHKGFSYLEIVEMELETEQIENELRNLID